MFGFGKYEMSQKGKLRYLQIGDLMLSSLLRESNCIFEEALETKHLQVLFCFLSLPVEITRKLIIFYNVQILIQQTEADECKNTGRPASNTIKLKLLM